MKENHFEEIFKEKRRAFLVGSYPPLGGKATCEENLKELAALGETFGVEIVGSLPCPLRKIESSTYLGSGKVQEIANLCEELHVDVVIFDEEISPHQQRNLEKTFNRAVIDRTELILGVFAQRARSKEAKLQIDLAQHHYQLPRLKRLWTHLERQRTGGSSGGGGYLKGAGEKQIEIDRRLLRKKIDRLHKELEEVRKHRKVQKKARERSSIPSFAIVGYTNSGKSTLMNALCDAKVFVEDKLFATLDTTTRKFLLPNRQEILLIDTVGFIRKLPHALVAAFRSTLEEAVEADILLHLIDLSNPRAEEQAKATYEVLKELKADKKTIITVLNKIDICKDSSLLGRLSLGYPQTVAISAKKKEGFDALLERMMREISLLRKVVHLRIPQERYAIVSELRKRGRVLSCEYEKNDLLLTIEIEKDASALVKEFFIEETS